VKVLLAEDGYPSELLERFEVVHTPQDDVVAVLTIDVPIGADLMDRLPALWVVATPTVGFDHIDVDAADERGVAVVSVPDYCTQEVADHTLALLYALLRGVVTLDGDVRRGGWNPQAAGPLRALAELRVGIVGLEPPPLAPFAPRLVLTPHAAFYSEAAAERSYRLAVARVRELLGA